MNIKDIVEGVVEKEFDNVKLPFLSIDDLKVVWENCWENIVDEAHHYGIFIADNTMPEMPSYLFDVVNIKEEMKKLLTQVAEERLNK